MPGWFRDRLRVGVAVIYLLAVLLGVIEGLTEFLPISSTAHLRLAQALLGLNLQDAYWKMFAVVIQLGAILAVVVYFWKRIVGFVKTFPKGEKGNKTFLTHPLTLVAIAFVTTAVPAVLLKKRIEHNLESTLVMAAALIIGGVIMWVVDVLCTRPKVHHVEDMSALDALWIGAWQIAAAVFPGTSRSMSTIAAGQIFGMSRPSALEFSFFLSIPTMLAATLKDLKDTIRPSVGTALTPTGEQWGALLVGTLVSFVVAWAVIAWFMAWVRTHGFVPFAIYRILVGLAVLAMIYAGKM